MKIYLDWQGRVRDEVFLATVPGNIQRDYGIHRGFGDVNYGTNVTLFEPYEDDTWHYLADFKRPEGTVHFVSHGIDYECNIHLNGNCIAQHEGAFSKIDIDITEYLNDTNTLDIEILPHPTAGLGRDAGRDQARHSAKAAVCYGWDWHPRLLTSGIWQDTYLETVTAGSVRNVNVTYTLNDARTEAQLYFDIDGVAPVTLYDPDGNIVYHGTDRSITVKNVRLWWCNGQGQPDLYRYEVDEISGTVGFKTVRLVMNDGAWKKPAEFPKSRSNPPITIELNGRRIFAKGSNWVRPELFPGICTEDTYRPLVEAASLAGMNIFRCWGGSEIFKEPFYDLCDRMGIMVWQEFPLACNEYTDDPHYLKILEQEARAIIKRIGAHASHVLWCGGNELFNSWSGMTDQSHALRLLNAVCYELDRNKPFIMTSPVMGMGHGSYTFESGGRDVFEIFTHSDMSAYTEFGVPSVAAPEYLRQFIPEEEYGFPLPNTDTWEKHHLINSWGKDAWMYLPKLEKYFGKLQSFDDIHKYSSILQCEGYRAIFEEARRQWPACSMAINWCYNEPWMVAAGNSLLSYPAIKKPCYYAVKDALRPVMPSARIEKFEWQEGEILSAELWLLNDSPERVCDSIKATVIADGTEYPLIEWTGIECAPNTNTRGHKVQFILGCYGGEFIKLKLKAACGISEYTLKYKPKKPKSKIKILNM